MRKWMLAAALVLGTAAWAQQPVESVIALRSAHVILKVNDFARARDRIIDLGTPRQALVTGLRTMVDQRGRRYGEMTLRLPADQLHPLLAEVHAAGTLYSEAIQTTDNTSDYERLARRIALLEQNSSELSRFLQRPRLRGSDILYVQYRLFQTRVEAADADQARADLQRGTRRSTLRVTLFEPPTRPPFDWRAWHARAMERGHTAFLLVFRRLAAVAYIIAYLSPFWLPLAILITVLVIRRRRRQRALVREEGA